MSKRPLRYYFIRVKGPGSGVKGEITNPCRLIAAVCLLLTAYCFTACAPKVISPPPPRYEEELSLDDIVTRAGKDIQVLKAVADIRIEKNGELIEQVNASVLLQRPDRVHMKIYKFGMLTGDFVMRDGELHGLEGWTDTKLGRLAGEIFHAVFWWDNLEGASMYSTKDAYIITTLNQVIHLDKATLLPVMQDINSSGHTVHVTYSGPRNYEGFWYPSNLTVSTDNFGFGVKIERLIKNPPLSEADFRVR
ncbi:MAG: hypothetical protein HZA16_00485 [Nitrospirae bacterium]|nr:hypothetical protein [Nitrospirota bacterium]